MKALSIVGGVAASKRVAQEQAVCVPVQDTAAAMERLVEDWVDFTKMHSGVKSAQSEKTYRGAIRQLYHWLAEQGKSVLNATDKDLFAWLESLRTSKAASTVQTYLVAARLFFAFLSKQGVIGNNPAEGMKAGVKTNREHKRDYLTTAQVKEMFAAMPAVSVKDKRDRALVALMVTAGLRCCEVQRAQYGDLRVVGDSHVLWIQGKGRSEKDSYVKVSPTAEKFLREYLTARFGGKAIKDSDYLFVSTSRNHIAAYDANDMLSTQAVRAIVKDAMKAIGLNDSRHSAHSLRHTAATLALKAGEDLTNVQAMLRHTNISTTLIYSHALEREKINPERTIDNLLFG